MAATSDFHIAFCVLIVTDSDSLQKHLGATSISATDTEILWMAGFAQNAGLVRLR